MKVLFYSVKDFERPYISKQHERLDVTETTVSLNISTAHLARGFDAISIFTGDDASGEILELLAEQGIRFIATRSAGYDNIDLKRANELHFCVANVPAYSPNAIAEHAVALLLALNRKLIVADRNVKKFDFRVGALTGFDLYGKKAGVIGMGKIGEAFARIMKGFGCEVFAHDIKPGLNHQVSYKSLEDIFTECDFISLHTPLTKNTRGFVNLQLLKKAKPGLLLINTSRGACVNTNDVITALETKLLAGYGADVYEKEKDIFFYDHSTTGIKDELLQKLMTFDNVIITPHQAFATHEALTEIARVTFVNLMSWAKGDHSENELTHNCDY